MNSHEFHVYYKNKSPLLFSYIQEEVKSSNIAQSLLILIFTKFFNIHEFKPESLSNEKFILIITRKILLDFYAYRISEEGQISIHEGLGSYEISLKIDGLKQQLLNWTEELSEEDQNLINNYVFKDVEPKRIKLSIKDKLQLKIKEIDEKHKGKK